MSRSRYGLQSVTFTMLSTFACAQSFGEESFALEEMIVTAQKRVETQQDVAASFNVYGEDSIERAQWDDVTDIADLVPSLEVVGVTKTRTSIFIRSIGTNKYDIGTEGSVGVFVDGIYVPRFSSIMQNLVDLDRVEILKGPQGTLYGRNTIGGAISLYTKDPQEEFGGSVNMEVGNENSYFMSSSFSGTLIDEKLVGYLALAKRESGGFRSELRTGAEDDEHVSSGRLKLLYMPNDVMTAQITFDYTDQKVEAFLGEPVIPPDNPTFFSITPPDWPPYISQAEIDAEIAKEAADMYSSETNLPGYTQVEAMASNLVLKWELEDLVIESVTGLRDEDTDELVDDDRVRFDISDIWTLQSSETFSQEIKVSSEEGGKYTLDDKIEWLGGVFLYRDDAVRSDWLNTGEDMLIHGLVGLLQGLPPGGFPFDVPPEFRIPTGSDFVVAGPPYPFDFDVDLVTDSWAVFGEVGVSLSDEVSFTFGLRASYDEKAFTYAETTPGNETNVLFLEDNYSFDDKIEFDSVDPKLVIEWEPEAMTDVMFYGSYTQGYKSGGIQFIARREEIARQSFDKEQLNSVEFGIKSRWFDQKMQFNAATYFYDYKDLQIQQIAWVTSTDGSRNVMIVTDNAGQSSVSGFEAEMQYLITADWFFLLSYNYMDSVFDEFISLSGEDFEGNVLPAAPENAVWISSEYTHALKQDWELGARIDYSWRDDQAFDAQNTFWEEAYGLLNFSLSLSSPDKAVSLKLFCSNCGDTKYRTSVIPLTTDTGWGATGDRRRWGASMKYMF